MGSNPAKRRKTGHSDFSDGYMELGSELGAASTGMFRPNTFTLQTAELLTNSRVDYAKLLPKANELLRDIKVAVESLEEHEPVLISKATANFEHKNAIRIPYPTPRPADDSLLKLSIEKPAIVNVVGSFVHKTMVCSQREFSVDMVVQMPKTLFQEKDYLNFRYFYKRAYYLAHLANAVAKALPDTLDLTFAYLGDNPLLPILVATPKNDSSLNAQKKHKVECKINIIPCCPGNLFPRKKLRGNKNSIRPDAPAAAATATEATDLPPTPFYNATLKAESSFLPLLKLLHDAQKTCPAFVDACLLGRIWLQQRGLGGSVARGGFGGFEFAALVALLLQTGSRKTIGVASAPVLLPTMGSVQIFRAVIQFLSSTDFRSKPSVLGGSLPAELAIDAIREGTTPVLYDAGRQLNIGYKMGAWSAGLLRQYAKWTHELLKSSSSSSSDTIDQFTPTFIAKADISLEAYDMVFRIRCPRLSDAQQAAQQPKTDRHGAVWDFGDSVFQVMRRAMGDRARLVNVQLPALPTWPLSKPCPESPAEKSKKPSKVQTLLADARHHLLVGVVFDPANMSRHIDHGPAAEDKKECRKFRLFWGERSELRRFKDGSITETLVWTPQTSAAALCEEITRYILGHRLKLLGDGDIEVLGRGFAPIVPLTAATDTATFGLARQAFATLESDIRALENPPLHVRQVVPISPALRSATIRPPAVHTPKGVLYPMDVNLYFEASGKWPDNLAAIQLIKIAFLLLVGEALVEAKAGEGIETRLGLEDAEGGAVIDSNAAHANDSENRAFLDIVYTETGAAFRLRIHSEMESALLSQQAKDKSLSPFVRAASAEQLARHRRLFVTLPRQTQTLATYATRFPALSPSVRLVKQWFSAHKLLGSHVSDELVELMVLHVFLQPQPWQVPGSATTGLLRTLQFLARWDWKRDPLVVDTSGSTNATEEVGDGFWGDDAAQTITGDPVTRLAAWRKIDPNMRHTVLFVAATHEMSGTAFTTASGGGGSRPMPSMVAATRMTALASAACRLVKQTDPVLALADPLSSSSSAANADLDPKLLFQPSLGDYDVLIHISPVVVKRLIKGDVVAATAGDDDDGSNQAAAVVKRRSVYKNLDDRHLESLPNHPVRLLLGQLNDLYGTGSSAQGGAGPLVFFYGAADGIHGSIRGADHVIGCVWNPQMQQRALRVNLPTSFRPLHGALQQKNKKQKKSNKRTEAEEDGEEEEAEEGQAQALVEVNREAILAEIARIGGALIDQIQVVDKTA